MIDLIRRFLDINSLAEWSLAKHSGAKKGFVCRGRIQLFVASNAVINPPNEVCYLGIRLLGTATPKNSTTSIHASSKAVISLNGVMIGRGVSLTSGSAAKLSIGSKTYIADGSRVSAQNSITIGKNCAISFGVTIIDDDGHGFGLPPYSAPIVIEDNVWIGCNVTVLKGVAIGEGSVIAAGAVVTKSCPPHSLMAGVPARVIREGVQWTDQSRLNNNLS